MNDIIIFLTQNDLILIAVLAILLALSLIFLRHTNKGLKQKNKENQELQEKCNHLMIDESVLKQRFADISETLSKNEEQIQIWQNTAFNLEKEYSAYRASSNSREEGLKDKIAYLEQIKEDLTLKFKAISSEIIKSQHETFSLAQKDTLSAIINPFSEQLKAFKTEVTAAREESIKNKSSLDAQLNNLANLNMSLSKDAQNLTEALKGGKKMQGNWGECQLSRILEISGLRKGQDYETQESFLSEDKKLYRPDVIVHLPENRDIIIDSKVSLNDYLEAINTEDEDDKQKFLQKNVAAIKAHIDELSAKEYQKLLKNRTLNYVMMFIPVESAYIAALDSDRHIYDYAYKKNIILATPLSLLPTLRTIENLWRIDNQNQNVEKIAELGGKIYDKLANFIEDMKNIEKNLNQAQHAYDNAITKLSGKGGAISQAEKMKLLGAKSAKIINLKLNDDDLLLEDKSTDSLIIQASGE